MAVLLGVAVVGHGAYWAVLSHSLPARSVLWIAIGLWFIYRGVHRYLAFHWRCLYYDCQTYVVFGTDPSLFRKTAAHETQTEQPGRRIALLLVWLLLIACLVAAFAHNFSEMWIRWFPAWKHAEMDLYTRITRGQSYYTHGPLVPLVSLVIGILLVRHARIKVRPQRVAGIVVLVLALLLHLEGSLARSSFLSGVAFIGVVTGLILLLWGAQGVRCLYSGPSPGPGGSAPG